MRKSNETTNSLQDLQNSQALAAAEEMPDIRHEIWEDDERIISLAGAPIGCSLSRREAELVAGWLRSAWPGIARYSAAIIRKHQPERVNEKLMLQSLRWFQWLSGPKHEGDCCFTDKSEEGCFLCRQAENTQWPAIMAHIEELQQALSAASATPDSPCKPTQPHGVSESIIRELADVARGAVSYVGAANYYERQQDAMGFIAEAEKKALTSATPEISGESMVIAEIVKQLRDVEARIEQGKGTWPQADYVRDEIWAMWRGERTTLRSLLYKAGVNPDDALLARYDAQSAQQSKGTQ